jgi:hypothetical protein
MKKIFLSLIVITCIHAESNAQMWLTVKGGGGVSTVMGYSPYQGPTYSGTTKVQPGIDIQPGIGYKHQISKRMELEGNILFDSRSTNYPTGVLDKDSNQIYASGGGSYLLVPITLHYNIPFRKKVLIPYRVDQPKAGWFIEGGPYFGYGLSVSNFNDPTIIALRGAEGDSITDQNLKPRKIDVGVTGGIGLNFPINEGKTRIVVGARGYYGMLSVYKDARLGKATNLSAVGYIALDFSLTKRKHIRHKW